MNAYPLMAETLPVAMAISFFARPSRSSDDEGLAAAKTKSL
jgi:hypothetical protein